jgi:peptidoglycan/LPS O-acetylase OafA/YrhL
VEEHSYLYLAALAGVAKLAGVRRIWLLALSMLACLGLNLYYKVYPPGGASPWFARSECAALGLIASATLRAIRHEMPALRDGAAWIAPVTLAVAAVCFSWSALPLLAITLGPLLLAVSVNYMASAPALMRRALSVAVLRWFGICSLSLYVWQQMAYEAYLHHVLQRQLAGGRARDRGRRRGVLPVRRPDAALAEPRARCEAHRCRRSDPGGRPGMTTLSVRRRCCASCSSCCDCRTPAAPSGRPGAAC